MSVGTDISAGAASLDRLIEEDKKKSATAAPPEAFAASSTTEVSEQMDQIVEDHAPGITAEEKNKVKILVGRRLAGGESTPTAKQTKQLIAQDPNNAQGTIQAITTAGGDRAEAVSGLLELLVPVLIGGAIRGKRGAAAAAVGAGTEKIKIMDEERATATKKSEAEADFAREKELQDLRIEGQLDVARAKEDMKPSREQERQENIEDALDTKMAGNVASAMDEADKMQGALVVGRDILSKWGDVTENEGRLSYQVKKSFSASELGKLRSEVEGLIFDIVKAKQGSRPSDFDVQSLMRIIGGDFTASPQDAYELLKRALDNSEAFVEARVISAKARLNNGKLSPEDKKTLEEASRNRRLAREMERLSRKQIKQMFKAKRANVSLDTMEELLLKTDADVSTELLTSMGFK